MLLLTQCDVVSTRTCSPKRISDGDIPDNFKNIAWPSKIQDVRRPGLQLVFTMTDVSQLCRKCDWGFSTQLSIIHSWRTTRAWLFTIYRPNVQNESNRFDWFMDKDKMYRVGRAGALAGRGESGTWRNVGVCNSRHGFFDITRMRCSSIPKSMG